MSDQTKKDFVAVEWGTALLRATLLSHDGTIQDRVAISASLRNMTRPDMVSHLETLHARWPQAAEELWLSGMIGSALGWEEVRQVECPATLVDIARATKKTTIGRLPCRILPGLSCRSLFGDPDILRGEEIFPLGWIAHNAAKKDVVLACVPGMHGKWIEIRNNVIKGFHTSMTVELFRLLEQHSVLGTHLAVPAAPDKVFLEGVTMSAGGGALGRLLFGVRSRVLRGELPIEQAASYAWGLLIGSDAGETVKAYAARCIEQEFAVVGDSEVSRLFAAAIQHLGLTAPILSAEQLSASAFAMLRRLAADLPDDSRSQSPVTAA